MGTGWNREVSKLLHFRTLVRRIDRGEPSWLCTVVDGNGNFPIGDSVLLDGQGSPVGALPFWLESHPSAMERIRDHVARGEAGLISPGSQPDAQLFVEPYFPPPRLIIFGSGHIAVPLAAMAGILSYRVTVIDDRPEYVRPEAFPGAEGICDDPVRAVGRLAWNSQTFVVLVTRGHQVDAQILEALAGRRLPYVGVVGSRRRVAGVMNLLRDRGIDPDQPHLHAPVGLDIGAETPEEIALSILGELQLVRHGGTGAPLSRIRQGFIHPSDGFRSRCDESLVREIDRNLTLRRPFVLATVISVRGHVPRGPGTKMIVYGDGAISRTLGGGRREEEIRRRSVEVLKEGRPVVEEVEFAGDYRSFQPVCGGRMKVLLQPFRPTE